MPLKKKQEKIFLKCNENIIVKMGIEQSNVVSFSKPFLSSLFSYRKINEI